MKKTISIIGILLALTIIIVLYSVFIYKHSDFIAGENRYYTLYENYQSKNKIIDLETDSYNNDIYHLKVIQTEIDNRIKTIAGYKQKFIKKVDDIKNNRNFIENYLKYIDELTELENNITIEKKHLESKYLDLIELNNFIIDHERNIFSIDKYIQDIDFTCLMLDLTGNQTNDYLNTIRDVRLKVDSIGTQVKYKIEAEKERLALLERERESLALLKAKEKKEINKRELLEPKEVYSFSNSYPFIEPDLFYLPKIESLNEYPTNINNSWNQTKYINPNAAPATVKVKGYYRSDGTYVPPHVRTAPNSTKKDNLRYRP
ncbi:MAG: hypothetical protein H3C31_01665 [Brumimicrobium sp.]|nr:hypothetical protein [Brumimicrobium sp.]